MQDCCGPIGSGNKNYSFWVLHIAQFPGTTEVAAAVTLIFLGPVVLLTTVTKVTMATTIITAKTNEILSKSSPSTSIYVSFPQFSQQEAEPETVVSGAVCRRVDWKSNALGSGVPYWYTLFWT